MEYRIKGDTSLVGKAKHGLELVGGCENPSSKFVLMAFKTREVLVFLCLYFRLIFCRNIENFLKLFFKIKYLLQLTVYFEFIHLPVSICIHLPRIFTKTKPNSRSGWFGSMYSRPTKETSK